MLYLSQSTFGDASRSEAAEKTHAMNFYARERVAGRRSGAVLAVLPNAGLGNKLLVWARAMAFAHINGLPFYAYGWSYPRLGPLLRGERRDVFYGRYFHSGGAEALFTLLRAFRLPKVIEPPVDIIADVARRFVFHDIPHWSAYFVSLHPHRDFIRAALWRTVKPYVAAEASELEAPLVALHVRCGDFRKLQQGENFAMVGAVRTPVDYFIELVVELRKCAGWCVPITVFSDGTASELEPLLSLEATRLAVASSDAVTPAHGTIERHRTVRQQHVRHVGGLHIGGGTNSPSGSYPRAHTPRFYRRTLVRRCSSGAA